MTHRLPQISALLSHPGAAEALLPVLRAIPPHRASVAGIAPRWPGIQNGISVGPGALCQAYLPGASPVCDVLIVHADPWHPLTGWAASVATALRERGTRVLAVQRGAFYGPPPPPSLDPDLLLSRGVAHVAPDPELRLGHVRQPWDSLAVWGPAFALGLPSGSRHSVTGSPVLEALIRSDLACQTPRLGRHTARMEVTRVIGLHPSALPVLIAPKLHAHWWPEDRVAALLAGVVEAVREKGMSPIILPHHEDGAEALRIYREVLIDAKVERPVVLTGRQWRKLDLSAWLLGVAAIVTQGGSEGILAAALGTPALAISPPDTPHWIDPAVVAGGSYRVVRDPLAYVREGTEKGLTELTASSSHDPLPFREHTVRAEGAAEQAARAALDLTHRRKKARPTRTATEPRAEAPRKQAEETVAAR